MNLKIIDMIKKKLIYQSLRYFKKEDMIIKIGKLLKENDKIVEFNVIKDKNVFIFIFMV